MPELTTYTICSRWNFSRIIHTGQHTSLAEAVGAAENLSGANLNDANLSGANLNDANLSGANLSDANLRGANLSDANLRGANLRGANLSDANLRGANLSDANLSGANLSGANLRGANLSDANLQHVKQDLIAEVLRLPNELEALRDAINDGRIDGSSYSGECACLAGTLAAARGIENYNGTTIAVGSVEFHASVYTPREQWFLSIQIGDTPDKSQVAALALQWVNEAIAIRDNIRAGVRV